MRILFIGGTGRLSKDAARYALETGNEVFLLTRGSFTRQRYVESGYRMLYADIRNKESCLDALREKHFDVVIDFLSYNECDLKLTLEILENKYSHYIFISSATVYNLKKDEIISEDSTEVGNDKWQYAYSKYLCERYVEDYFVNQKKGYYTIVRPYVTYGNTRVPYPLVPRNSTKEWSLVQRIIEGKAVPVLDEEPVYTSILHTKDFAVGLIGLCMNPAAYEQSVHIANETVVTWETVLDVIGEVLNVPVIKKRISKDKVYQYMPEYKPVLEGDKARNMRFNNNKIIKMVPEYKISVNLENGIRDMVEYYTRNEDLQLIDENWMWCIDQMCTERNLTESGIVIYGAGNYGKWMYRFLNCIGLNVQCFCQTDKGSTDMLYETPVITREELMQLENVKAVFIAIADKEIAEEIRNILKNTLIEKVSVFVVNEFVAQNKDILN